MEENKFGPSFQMNIQLNRDLCISELELPGNNLDSYIGACDEYFSCFGDGLNGPNLDPNLKSTLLKEDYELMFKEGVLRISKYVVEIKENYGSRGKLQSEPKLVVDRLTNLTKALLRFETLIDNCDDEKIVSLSKKHYSDINMILSRDQILPLEDRILLSKSAKKYSSDNLINLNLAKLYLESGNYEDCFKEGLIPIQESKNQFKFKSNPHRLYEVILARALYQRYMFEKECNIKDSNSDELTLNGNHLDQLILNEDGKIKFGTSSDYQAYSLFARFILERRNYDSFNLNQIYQGDEELSEDYFPSDLDWEPSFSDEDLDIVKLLFHSVELNLDHCLTSGVKSKYQESGDQYKYIGFILERLSLKDGNDDKKYNFFSDLWEVSDSYKRGVLKNIISSKDRKSELILGRLFYENKENLEIDLEISKHYYGNYFNCKYDEDTGKFKFSNEILNDSGELIEKLYVQGDIENYLQLILSESNFKGDKDSLPDGVKHLLDLGESMGLSRIKSLQDKYIVSGSPKEETSSDNVPIPKKSIFENIQIGSLINYWDKFRSNTKQ